MIVSMNCIAVCLFVTVPFIYAFIFNNYRNLFHVFTKWYHKAKSFCGIYNL